MAAKIIDLNKVRIDGGTQSRAAINVEAVSEYAAVLKNGGTLPALDVFYDGTEYWLADGFHRWHAYATAEVEKGHCEVHKGTVRDAILFSVGANAKHGLRRTNEDKRKSVLLLLDDKEWSGKSDRWIAEQCAVSHDFASRMREELSSNDSCETPTRIGRDGKRRKKPKKKKAVKPAPPPESEEDDVEQEADEPTPDYSDSSSKSDHKRRAQQAAWDLFHALDELDLAGKWNETLEKIRKDIAAA